jgi:hypothetical protein
LAISWTTAAAEYSPTSQPWRRQSPEPQTSPPHRLRRGRSGSVWASRSSTPCRWASDQASTPAGPTVCRRFGGLREQSVFPPNSPVSGNSAIVGDRLAD